MAQTSQTTQPVDPKFAMILSADITGRFITHTKPFDNDKVEQEFRNAVQDAQLLVNEPFMHNLMFLVRKREIVDLRDDVRETLLNRGLPRRAVVSAMKTLYALGEDDDRRTVDDRLHTALKRQLARPNALSPTPYVTWAERIGGEKTLTVLREFLALAEKRLQAAQTDTPDDFAGIKDLDSLRTDLANQIGTLERKFEILEMPPEQRAPVLVELYLGRVGHLGFWAYKLLVDDQTPETLAAVRRFLAQKLGTLLPAGGITPKEKSELTLDYSLRGVCLVEAMKAELTEQEQKSLDDNAAMLAERELFFRPGHDWEDVMDRQ